MAREGYTYLLPVNRKPEDTGDGGDGVGVQRDAGKARHRQRGGEAESFIKCPICLWRVRSKKWIHDVTVPEGEER